MSVEEKRSLYEEYLSLLDAAALAGGTRAVHEGGAHTCSSFAIAAARADMRDAARVAASRYTRLLLTAAATATPVVAAKTAGDDSTRAVSSSSGRSSPNGAQSTAREEAPAMQAQSSVRAG